MRIPLAAFLLSFAVGSAACFPVPVPVHDYEAEHRDPRIVIYDYDPGPGHDCWRHEDHWHCRRE